MTEILTGLGFNFIVVIALMLGLWRVACAIRDVSFIDAVWPLGMVLLAITSMIQAPNEPNIALVLMALVAIWGLRLGIHLYTRWRRMGVDPRYEKILGRAMDKNGWGFPRASLIMVFAMQGPLLFLVSLPVQLGILAAPGSGTPPAWTILGPVLCFIGLFFESVGDWQLERFRANPANKGKVLDTGLWRFTRHPNYFGDACFWWGIWAIALAIDWRLGLISTIGPVFLTFTLMKWSGVALLERGLKKSRPGYKGYIRRTSAFFPMPPRKA